MTLRDELIQVAAVAVAIVEDLDYGSADYQAMDSCHSTHTAHVLDDVWYERREQDRKWGPQHHDPATWLAILAEEVGEVAREISMTEADWESRLVRSHLELAEEYARAYLELVGAA